LECDEILLQTSKAALQDNGNRHSEVSFEVGRLEFDSSSWKNLVEKIQDYKNGFEHIRHQI